MNVSLDDVLALVCRVQPLEEDCGATLCMNAKEGRKRQMETERKQKQDGEIKDHRQKHTNIIKLWLGAGKR